MRALEPPSYSIAVLLRLFALLMFAGAPSAFWSEVIDIINVPEEIKVLVLPLVGAACMTCVEIIQQAETVSPTHQIRYWPLKIAVGWVVGTIGAPLVMPFVQFLIKVPVPTSAVSFLVGALGYWWLSKYLQKRLKKIEKQIEDDEDEPVL